MKDCIFCKIVGGSLPSEKVHETENVLVFKNINPVSSVHLLIVPKIHIPSFTDMNESHKDIVSEMFSVARKVISLGKISGGYKLVFNGGKYQAINHLHWHLLGGEMKIAGDVINET